MTDRNLSEALSPTPHPTEAVPEVIQPEPAVLTPEVEDTVKSISDQSSSVLEYKPVFDTPEKNERIRQRIEDTIDEIIYHDVKVIFFLDRSARPIYWMIKAAWDAKKIGRPMPKVKFLNIGSEKRKVLGSQDQPQEWNFASESEHQAAVKEHWAKLNSADYLAKVKKDISPLLTDEGVDVFNKPYKGRVMVIDDISISGVTMRMATEFLQHHFPGVKVYDHALLNQHDEDVFPPLSGGMWTNFSWNSDADKDYTLMSPQDDPLEVVAKPELDKNKRKKGLGLKREIEGIFKADALGLEKGKALSLAEKIPDPKVMQTAKEIADDLFDRRVFGNGREILVSTLRKYREVKDYLEANAKELVEAFQIQFRKKGIYI